MMGVSEGDGEMTTVADFSMDSNGSVVGPAAYMESPTGFQEIKAKIESGRSAVFNYSTGTLGNPVELATLVAVQTHYAGWKGMQEFVARQAMVRESQLAAVAQHKASKARGGR